MQRQVKPGKTAIGVSKRKLSRVHQTLDVDLSCRVTEDPCGWCMECSEPMVAVVMLKNRISYSRQVQMVRCLIQRPSYQLREHWRWVLSLVLLFKVYSRMLFYENNTTTDAEFSDNGFIVIWRWRSLWAKDGIMIFRTHTLMRIPLQTSMQG